MSLGAGRAGWIAALICLLLMIGLLAGPGRAHMHTHTSDTNQLVAGARVASACIGDGTWSRCGYRPERTRSTVGSYPLLQYLPTFGLQALGLDDQATLHGLVDLNLAAFVGAVALVFLLAPRPRTLWMPVLLATLLSGPLLVYSRSAFGEMLTASIILAAVAAANRRRPMLCAPLVVLACLGKETMAPFVVVLCVIAARDEDDGWLPPAAMTAAIGFGAAVGVVINGLFNIFRYGTVGNRFLLQEEYRVTSLGRVMKNVGSLVAAPAGGLFVFWPLLTIILALALVSALRLAVDGRWRRAAPSLAALACGAGWLVGLGSWWAPFGGMSWGPRLALPLLPALVVVVAIVGGAPLSRLLERVLRTPLTFVLVSAVVLVAAWPQLSAPWHQVDSIGGLLRGDAACPKWVNTFVSPETYWHCFDHRVWRLTYTPIGRASRAGGTAIWGARLVGLVALAACLFAAHRAAVRLDRGRSTSRRPGRHGQRKISRRGASRSVA